MTKLNRVSLFALAGGAAILAAVASAPQAEAHTVGSGCFEGASTTGSTVTSSTSAISGGFSYNFSICNTNSEGTLLVDWELPYFAAAGITNIRSPEGWTFAIETVGVANPATGWAGVAEWQTPGDAWKTFFDAEFGGAANNPFNTNTLVLHWYTPLFCVDDGEVGFCGFEHPLPPGSEKDGFGFDSPIGPGAAPYQASFAEAPVRTGDPDFPLAGIPIPTGDPDPIPVPGTLALFGAALLGGLGLRRRK